MVSRAIVLLMILGLSSVCHGQQSTNLLQNPEADALSAFWRVFGEATIERTAENGSCFVVRNGGYSGQARFDSF